MVGVTGAATWLDPVLRWTTRLVRTRVLTSAERSELVDEASTVEQDSAWLTVRIFGDLHRCDVESSGELDLCTVDQLRDALQGCAAIGTRLIVLDLTELGFLSVAGLDVFVDAHEVLAALGGRLVLTGTSRAAQRILALTGLDAVLDVELDLGQLAGSSLHMPTGRLASHDYRIG